MRWDTMQIGYNAYNQTLFLHGSHRKKGMESTVKKRMDRYRRKSTTASSKGGFKKQESSVNQEEAAKQQAEDLDDIFIPKLSDIADFKFRSELMRLMGSEVIRISDNTWTTRFQDSLMEDFGRKLDAKEQRLAEAETERIHRLRLEGLITGSTCEKSDEVMKKAFTPNRLKASRFIVRPFRRKSSVDKEPEPIFRDEKINIRERAVSARRTARTYQAPVKTILQADPGKKDELEGHPVHLEQYLDHKGHLKEETMSLSGDKLRGRRPTIEMSRNKMLKRLPPPVVKLYEAETVSSLYKCAEQIVGHPRVKKSPRGEDDEQAVKFQ